MHYDFGSNYLTPKSYKGNRLGALHTSSSPESSPTSSLLGGKKRGRDDEGANDEQTGAEVSDAKRNGENNAEAAGEEKSQKEGEDKIQKGGTAVDEILAQSAQTTSSSKQPVEGRHSKQLKYDPSLGKADVNSKAASSSSHSACAASTTKAGNIINTDSDHKLMVIPYVDPLEEELKRAFPPQTYCFQRNPPAKDAGHYCEV
jgi:hypothetical protein